MSLDEKTDFGFNEKLLECRARRIYHDLRDKKISIKKFAIPNGFRGEGSTALYSRAIGWSTGGIVGYMIDGWIGAAAAAVPTATTIWFGMKLRDMTRYTGDFDWTDA